MNKIIKIRVLYQTLSPLTHMMGTSGNESIINREPVFVNNTKRYIPIISGNQIRHVLVRESGVNHMLELYNVKKLSNLDQLNFLYTGGALVLSSTSSSVSKIKGIYERLPLIKLLGGSLRNQIITGMMLVGRGIMICEENRDILKEILPSDYFESLPELLLSAEMYVGQYQYTRGDVEKQNIGKIKEKQSKLFDTEKKKEKSNLMIYNGQTVITGAYFVNEFILQDVFSHDIGAFFSALKYWGNNNSTLGGYGRIGHGKVRINILDDYNIEDYISEYEKYMRKKSNIEKYLDELFPEKQDKKNAES
jgi:hypothetical protein